MIKQLTLFCTFAIFMLAVGGAVTPVWAHCEDKHSGDHPHCPPSAESDDLHDVFIDGGIDGPGLFLPGEGWNWIWNGRQVTSTYAQGRIFPLDMAYLADQFVYGDMCFGEEVEEGDESYISYIVGMGGFFRKHRKSTARGSLWFWGKTIDGNDFPLYLLIIEGYFGDTESGGFPGNGKIMWMTDWELKVENQGADVISRSCVGEGDFDSAEVKVVFVPIPEE